MSGSSKACERRNASLLRALPGRADLAVRDAIRESIPGSRVSGRPPTALRLATGHDGGLRRSAVPSAWSTLRRTRGLAVPSAAPPTSGTKSYGANVSLDGRSARQDARHHRRNPLPVLGLGHKLLLASLGDRVELRTAVVFRDTPLRSNPPSLLEAHQRRIDSPLIENDPVPADLFNPAGDAVPMERSQRG